MGADKAFVSVDGRPMVLRAVKALSEAGAQSVRITGGDTDRLVELGLVVDADPTPFAGPLAALVTSLERATQPVVAVLSCDLPNASAGTVRAMVEALGAADAAVPIADGHHQWLHGVWRRSTLPTLQHAYDQGERAIRRAVEGLDISRVEGLAAITLRDADTPADLPTTTYPAAMDIPETDIEAFARRREQGVPLLDVRQPDEYEEAHVPGAVLIPLDELPDRLSEVPAGDLHVICRTGGRSAKAVEFLAANDIEATNVHGGTMGWIEAGHPVDRGTGSA